MKLKNKIKVIRSTCRTCYNSCGILITLKNEIPFKLEGDPENPVSKGLLCPKGYASLEYLNHPNRLKHPIRRIGKRGEGKWERISWEEALEMTAQGLKQSKDRYGILSNVFIRGASKGLSDDLLARFANIFGSPNIASPAPYCFVPGTRASKLTYGYYSYPDYIFGPKVIIVWGINPAASNHLDYEEIQLAKRKGSKLIVIDPLENELTNIADIWLRLRPGTDTALGLGIINTMISENLYDNEFVNNWTIGLKELKKHVNYYTPEQVEKITWVKAEHIRQVARIYSFLKPGVIIWGNGIEHNVNSFQSCRTIAILRALSGNLGIPGGEIKYSRPGELTRGDPEFLCQNNIPTNVREQRLSKKDGILPINYYTLPQRIVKAILEDDPYPVRAAYIQAANILTHWPNAQKTYKALQKLDFIAVAEQFLTPTAEMADIVLPVATYLEFDSVEQPWHYPIVSVQQKVAQIGECKSDGQILNELIKKVGYPEYAFEDMEMLLDRVLKPSGVTFKEFKKIGYFVGKRIYRHYARGGFDTKSNKVELYSKVLDKWGFDPLPLFKELPETMYSEPELSKEYPLIMTSRKADVYRHSGGRQIYTLRKIYPEPVIKIHPKTAANIGVRDGDMVYISTKRGRIEQKVELSDTLDERVVQIDYAWWFPEKSGEKRWKQSNINMLTDDESPFNREMGSPNMRGILCRVWKKPKK